MSRLQSALHAYPPGSYVTDSMARATKSLNSHFFDRGQVETRMAATLLRQNPSMSRTDALILACELLDRAELASMERRDCATTDLIDRPRES